jgi:hypothetical protein
MITLALRLPHEELLLRVCALLFFGMLQSCQME